MKNQHSKNSRARNRVPTPLFALGLFGIISLGLFASGIIPRPDASQASDAHHAPTAARIVFGPRDVAGRDAHARLEVASADEHATAGAIPTGQKTLVTVRLSDPRTGAMLAGLNPTIDLALVGAASNSNASDPFESRETMVFAGSSVGVIEEGGHTHNKPGRGLGKAVGANFTAMINLPNPAADAALDREHRYIFITLPQSDQVVIVDALTHRLAHQVRVGARPNHLALEPSGKRVWVANDGAGTLTAIDTATHDTQTVAVGAGHHDIVFADDQPLMFVTNSQANTVSIIHLERAQKIADVPVGNAPHGLDYAARRLYVANEGDGTVTVLSIEGERATPLTVIRAGAGARQVKLDPTGKIGAVSNYRANTLTLFNAQTHALIKTIATGGGPDGIVFFERYVIVRNTLTPDATFAHLDNPDIADNLELSNVPLLASPAPDFHARLFVAGEMVIAPHPVTGQLQRLHLMHGRPMPMDQLKATSGAEFVLSLANTVKEIRPGVYQRVVQFDRAGAYALRVNVAGQAPIEFTLDVASARAEKAARAQLLTPAESYQVGAPAVIRFRVHAPDNALTDGTITVYKFTPGQGIWQKILPAEFAGNAVYQITLEFPDAGEYAATFSSVKLGLLTQDSPRFTVNVVK
ncbi:MAG: YncE family protein [Chloroflexi bacterium]|nr:YncE family protein [Chloroflexota bacterium]